MARAIQIVVVAALISAWIWVFRRSLVTGVLALSGRLPNHDPFDRDHSRPDAGLSGKPVRDWLAQQPVIGSWLQRPLVARRRQLLLATLFATFASFLLAIALRDRWVQLLGLMLVILVVHLGIAAHKGGRMVEARQRSQLDAARRQARPAGVMTIRASRARVAIDDLPHRRILAGDVAAPASTGATRVVVGLEPAAPIQELEVSSLVEELIEQAWGPTDAADAEADVGADAQAVGAPIHETDPVNGAAEVHQHDQSEVVADTTPPAGQPAGPEPADPEPIFTKAASQTSARPRRRPRPIYIHSHLDDDGFTPPKAVNHP